MVFESLIADLLNKYLGEYVENLDRSQLKIGIWGGKLSHFNGTKIYCDQNCLSPNRLNYLAKNVFQKSRPR